MRPKCNLCSPGSAGTLTCTKTANVWNETQTWIIGGVPQQTMGSTEYPAIFTATGKGSFGSVTWTVNVTASGTLNVSGTQQSPVLSTSQITFPFNDIPSSPTGHEATEYAFQIPSGSFLLSHPTYTYSGPCNLPVPGAVRSIAPGTLPSNKTSSRTLSTH